MRLPSSMPFACSPFPRFVVASLRTNGENSQQITERSEIEIQVFLLEPEVLRELVHALLELHERLPETLDLLVVEVPHFHAAERLALHQLPQELDQGEHELSEPTLDVLRVGLDPARQRAPRALEIARDRREVAACEQQPVDALAHAATPSCSGAAKLYGGHGPVHAKDRSSCRRCARSTAARKLSRSAAGTRYAARSSAVGPTLYVRVAARARSASGGWMSSASASRRARSRSRCCMYSRPDAPPRAGCCGAMTCRPISTQPATAARRSSRSAASRPAASSRSSRSRKPRPKRTGSTASFAAASESMTRACARMRSSVGSNAPSISATTAETAPSGATIR